MQVWPATYTAPISLSPFMQAIFRNPIQHLCHLNQDRISIKWDSLLINSTCNSPWNTRRAFCLITAHMEVFSHNVALSQAGTELLSHPINSTLMKVRRFIGINGADKIIETPVHVAVQSNSTTNYILWWSDSRIITYIQQFQQMDLKVKCYVKTLSLYLFKWTSMT